MPASTVATATAGTSDPEAATGVVRIPGRTGLTLAEGLGVGAASGLGDAEASGDGEGSDDGVVVSAGVAAGGVAGVCLGVGPAVGFAGAGAAVGLGAAVVGWGDGTGPAGDGDGLAVALGSGEGASARDCARTSWRLITHNRAAPAAAVSSAAPLRCTRFLPSIARARVYRWPPAAAGSFG